MVRDKTIWNDDLKFPLLISAVLHVMFLVAIFVAAKSSPKMFIDKPAFYIDLQANAPSAPGEKVELPKGETKPPPPPPPKEEKVEKRQEIKEEPPPEPVDNGLHERISSVVDRLREIQKKLAKVDPTPTPRRTPKPKRTATPAAVQPVEEATQPPTQEQPTSASPIEPMPTASTQTADAQTSTQAGSPEGTSNGPIQLGDANFQYSPFLTVLQGRLRENWAPPADAETASQAKMVVCKFRINQDGSMTDLKVDQTSGNKGVDDSAMLAIERSSPFPPLPADYTKGYLDVTVQFSGKQTFDKVQ